MIKKISTTLLLLTCIVTFSQDKLLFFQTNWGNKLSWDAFCKRAKTSGFDGIDIWLPSNEESQQELKEALKKHDLLLNLMHGTNNSISFEESLEQFEQKLIQLLKWNPVLVNCHTGSDFFTMEQNLKFIEVANKLSRQYNIPVYHETHRGRFSYNFPDTKKYLGTNNDLKLTLDISHWMVVHESLLEGLDEELEQVIANTNHIHARVGHAEGPQVNDPQAPEWKRAVKRHLDIWEKIIRKRWKENNGLMTITSEFGPAGYLPTLPYTRIPVSDQWKANVYIMEAIKKRMKLN